MNLLILQPLSDELRGIVAAELPPDFTLSVIETTDPAHMRAKIADADCVVFWDVGISSELLEAAPKLRFIHKWGVGLENLDLDAARARGIGVARTTGGNSVPVAEFAVGLMIAAGRRIVAAHQSMQRGEWAKNQIWRQSIMLSGKTVGIIGLGAIGKQVAQRVRGFDCTVLYHNRTRLDAAAEAQHEVAYASLAGLLAASDVLCLTCPLTPETRDMIAAPQLAAMKRGAILVNVARGGIVVEADLVQALRSGHLAAAAIDVFDPEPPPPDNPLLHMDQVIVTPHCASTAFENSAKGVRHWISNIQRFQRGEPLPAVDLVL